MRRSLSRFAAQVDVEAVLQEALLRVWQVATRVEPDAKENALLRLAHVIARNLAVSELRRKRPIVAGHALVTEVADADADAAESAAAMEPAEPDPFLRAVIQQCREKLPEKPGLALTARLEAAGAHSDHQLADELGMRVNTFLQNFTRARRMLAECLARMGVELDLEMS